MVFYECDRCGYDFDTKQKLHRHQNKNNCHTKVADLRKELAAVRAQLAALHATAAEVAATTLSAENTLVYAAVPPLTTIPLRTPLRFIDLFCGIGGFHQALASLGAECVLACDIDAKCREVYKDNYGIEPKPDVTTLVTADIPDFDILCAGFPCQAFSHAGRQGGFEDTRGTLFRDICRILREKKPKYFLLENVKNLKGHDKGNTWATIYKCLTESGYTTYETPIVLSPHQLGIPQHRERVMILGWRNDVLPATGLPTLPKVSPPATVHIGSVLLDDADVPEGTRLSPSDIEVLNLWDEVVVHFRTKGVKLPTFPMWSNDWDSTYDLTVVADEKEAEDDKEAEDEKDEKDEKEDEEEAEDEKEDEKEEKEAKKAAPAASRGAVSTRYKIPLWKQKFIRQNRDFYAANSAFLGPWLRRARDTVGFTGAKRKLEWQAGKFQEDDSIWKLLFQFRPSGIRVKRANYSPALVAMAQIVYVGEKRRKLSPREVARLQSFPDSFRLPAAANVAYKQFGNSVNVEVIQYAARVLLSGV